MERKKIIVLGSCNTDMVIKSDRIPVPGETILGGAFMMNSGGKGANQAVAAARLGGNVTFIAKTGNDLFGKQAIQQYKEEGIDTQYIVSDPNLPSGVALITVDKNGENCIVVAMGANSSLIPADFKKAEEELKTAEVLLMQLETPIETIEYAAQFANENGVKVILNPAPAQSLSDSLLKNLYMLILNETEAELISGIKVDDFADARKAATAICEKGVEKVIITMGSRGSLLKDENNFEEVSAYKVNAADTTAAGDTYCGAVAVAIAEGKSLLEGIKFATKCSAVTVTKMGAQASIPTRKEVDNTTFN